MTKFARGLVVAATLLACTSASGQTEAPGHDATLYRLSLAERASAASSFFRLAKTSEDKQVAVRLLAEAADQGDARAATELGIIFLSGLSNIAPNPDIARKYLEAAIGAGSADATFQMGRALVRGDGLTKDVASGVKLLARKLVNNSPLAAQAAYELGQIYLVGDVGVDANPVKAREYLERAIKGDVAEAKLKLGLALVAGDGVPADPAMGIGMLQDVRGEGGPRGAAAAADLAELYLVGAPALAPDPVLARQFLDEAVAAGDQFAALLLGQELLDGKRLQGDALEGVEILSRLSAQDGRRAARAGRVLGNYFLETAKDDPTNAHKARFYLERAAEQGDEGAKFYLGRALLTGKGLPQDVVRGEELLTQVIATANPLAAKAHFELALHQLSMPSGSESAKTHLEASAAAGFAPAKLRLGEELLGGAALASDPRAAVNLLQQLSNENGAEADAANLQLGIFFLAGGGGIKPNPQKARLYLEKAADSMPEVFIQLGDAELAGELGTPNGVRARTYFDKAGAAGISDAAVYSARVYLSGEPGVTRNVSKGMKLLEEAAAAGSVFATREIIAVYRGDGLPGQERDFDKAHSHIEALKKIGDEEDVLTDEALLSIAITPDDLASDAAAFNRIPASRQREAMRRVFSIAPKVAVYITQKRLESAGLYAAGIDGIAGPATLRAIAAACDQGKPSDCTSKPLSGKTSGFIVMTFEQAAPALN